jgi:hypothetical protein
VRFHALFRDATTGEIAAHSTDDYLAIHPNTIADTFLELYDRDVERALGSRTVYRKVSFSSNSLAQPALNTLTSRASRGRTGWHWSISWLRRPVVCC